MANTAAGAVNKASLERLVADIRTFSVAGIERAASMSITRRSAPRSRRSRPPISASAGTLTAARSSS